MWMEDSEKEDLTKETLFRQFSIVRKETNTSHVQARFFLFITIFIEYYNSRNSFTGVRRPYDR